MIALRPLGTVLFQGRLVFGEPSLFQLEWVLSLTQSIEGGASGRLEGFLCLELRLEVHPVLGGVAEALLKVSC